VIKIEPPEGRHVRADAHWGGRADVAGDLIELYRQTRPAMVLDLKGLRGKRRRGADRTAMSWSKTAHSSQDARLKVPDVRDIQT